MNPHQINQIQVEDVLHPSTFVSGFWGTPAGSGDIRILAEPLGQAQYGSFQLRVTSPTEISVGIGIVHNTVVNARTLRLPHLGAAVYLFVDAFYLTGTYTGPVEYRKPGPFKVEARIELLGIDDPVPPKTDTPSHLSTSVRIGAVLPSTAEDSKFGFLVTNDWGQNGGFFFTIPPISPF